MKSRDIILESSDLTGSYGSVLGNAQSLPPIFFLQISAKSCKTKIENRSYLKNYELHKKNNLCRKMSVRSIPTIPVNLATLEEN